MVCNDYQHLIDQALETNFDVIEPSLDEENNCAGVLYKMHCEANIRKGNIILLYGMSQEGSHYKEIFFKRRGESQKKTSF